MIREKLAAIAAFTFISGIVWSLTATKAQQVSDPKTQNSSSARQNTQATPPYNAAQVLNQQGFKTLLDDLNNSQLQLPVIHTDLYCKRASTNQKAQCVEGIKFGKQLYAALKKHQADLWSVPLSDLEPALKRLAVFRNRLWQNGRLGDVLLADFVDRIIFWHIAYRATFAPLDENQRIDSLRQHYADVLTDWKTVALALEREFGVKLNYQSIINGTSMKGDVLEAARVRKLKGLERIYAEISVQIESRFNWENVGLVSLPIPQMLETGKVEDFLFRRSAVGINPPSTSKAVYLQHYIELVTRWRQANPDADIKTFFASQRQFEKLSAELMPEIARGEGKGINVVKPDWAGIAGVAEGVQGIQTELQASGSLNQEDVYVEALLQ